MKKAMKKIFSISSVFIILIALTVIAFVQYWTHTEAGKVPAKTAVLLHAVHHNLVTTDTQAPRFFQKAGLPSVTSQMMKIPVDDGSTIDAKIYKPIEQGPQPIILY